jgi:hypothetical protein
MSRTLTGGSTGLPDDSGTYEVRYARPTPTELGGWLGHFYVPFYNNRPPRLLQVISTSDMLFKAEGD